MLRKIVFDIETKNVFGDVRSNDPSKLDLSMVGVYEYETNLYHAFFEEDLPKLWPIIERSEMLIGYNSDHFDIPILNKYYNGDLTKIKSLDLMQEVRKTLGRRLSLNQLAEATLGEKKSGHGLQAIEWWKKGDLESLKKYCLDDVRITKEIYDFAFKNKKLKFMDGSHPIEVKVDTDGWEKKEESAMTFSLPF